WQPLPITVNERTSRRRKLRGKRSPRLPSGSVPAVALGTPVPTATTVDPRVPEQGCVSYLAQEPPGPAICAPVTHRPESARTTTPPTTVENTTEWTADPWIPGICALASTERRDRIEFITRR